MNPYENEDVRFRYSFSPDLKWEILFSHPATTTEAFEIIVDSTDRKFVYTDASSNEVRGVFHERKNEIALAPGRHGPDDHRQLFDLVLTWPNNDFRYYIGTISDDTFENLPREKQEECDADCAAN